MKKYASNQFFTSFQGTYFLNFLLRNICFTSNFDAVTHCINKREIEFMYVKFLSILYGKLSEICKDGAEENGEVVPPKEGEIHM